MIPTSAPRSVASNAIAELERHAYRIRRFAVRMGGSLGQGLTIAVGMALGLRLKGNPAFVYNSMSDGELDEGATWKAAMAAAHHKLGNLIVLVDLN
jgi:transketolase N-terminal domain/subunit